MGNRSRLSDAQRREAVELFRQGYAVALAAKKMGVDRRWLKSLYGRWRVVGDGVLSVDRRRPRTYTFEVKLEVVRRYAKGETRDALAREFDLSGPSLVAQWHRAWREGGDMALAPKKRGRPRKTEFVSSQPVNPDKVRRRLDELEAENYRLQLEVAYLKKLRELRS